MAKLAEHTGYLPLDDAPGQLDTALRRARYFAVYLAAHAEEPLLLDSVEQLELVTMALPALSTSPQPGCTILLLSIFVLKPGRQLVICGTYSFNKEAVELINFNW